jgi:uncharacterized membrane protein
MATDTAVRGGQEQSSRDVAKQGKSCSVNVGMDERHVTLVLGGMMTAMGLMRFRPLTALLGGALVYRGMTGHCSAYQALGINTNERE